MLLKTIARSIPLSVMMTLLELTSVGSFAPVSRSVRASPVSTSPVSSPQLVASSAPAFAAQKTPTLDPEALVKLLDQGSLRSAIRLVERGWKRQYEDYAQRPLPSRFLEARGISRALRSLQRKTGKKTALIYAIPTPKHLELLLLTPDGTLIHRRTLVPRTQLLQTARGFRSAIADDSTLPSQYIPRGQTLHQWMIVPLESVLKAQKIDTLIFCLGGGLRSLPLAALHDGEQFLVERYSLAIIPAFNLLDRRPARLQNARILAMGASEFKEQEPLPAVPLELTRIVDRPQRGETWLNQDFTIAQLKSRRKVYPFSIIHLATHAKFLPGKLQQSYIQFWDNSLRLNQIQDLELRSPTVSLLVLSACQTALGDLQAELGFAGLAIQSGSQAALASLWSVSDAGTLSLMEAFYGQLQTAPTKAEALRQTQMAMIKASVKPPSALPLNPSAPPMNFSHPYYWSAFTVIGNPW